MQTVSGKIYAVGGLDRELVIKSVFAIDEDLVVKEVAMMKTARFNAPVTLLKDKYLVVAGGEINVSK